MLEYRDFINKFTEMQQKTVEATREVAKQIHPGQSEEEIAKNYRLELAKRGLFEHWYPILVYVGDSTSLPLSRRYHLPSSNVIVKENDIVILDCTPQIGTVWSNWAETFVIGDDNFYQSLIKDAKSIVDKVYDFVENNAKNIQDIYDYALKLIEEGGFISLDPMGDVGHSIFQVPRGQTVDKTPEEDRLFIFSEHGKRPIEGIISIEPQISKKHPRTGKVFSVKAQRVFITN